MDESAPARPAPELAVARLEEVYDAEFTYVYKTLGRLGVASSDLDDAVHDVFLVLHRRWSEVDPARPIRPWLFGIARRVAAASRRRRREELVDVPDARSPRAAHDANEAHVRRDLLWRALGDLSDERLEVIVLHDIEGHTGLAIAAQLGLSPNTVHSRLRLARADLVEAVRRHEGSR